MARKRQPLKERFMGHVAVGDGCWAWLAAKNKDGYGTIQVDGRKRLAHRISHELFIGPIPDDLVIDHLCRNRSCVNPSHIEAVTAAENINRGPKSATKATCINGHAYTPENTALRGPNDSGQRRCRRCNADAARRYQERKRAS